MGRYRITCIVHDENNVITEIGIGDQRFTVNQIIDYVRRKVHSYYTKANGYEAEVYSRQRSDTGTWYLTTSPDGVAPNNLDSLPECPI